MVLTGVYEWCILVDMEYRKNRQYKRKRGVVQKAAVPVFKQNTKKQNFTVTFTQICKVKPDGSVVAVIDDVEIIVAMLRKS